MAEETIFSKIVRKRLSLPRICDSADFRSQMAAVTTITMTERMPMKICSMTMLSSHVPRAKGPTPSIVPQTAEAQTVSVAVTAARWSKRRAIQKRIGRTASSSG